MPNLKAKYIIDENGDRVAPITYIDAVRNSNGESLSDLIVPEKLGSGIGVCSTSSGTALTVSLTDYELVQNGFVAVTFENDVPANATLNVNSKGAKPIYYKGAAIEADTIKADDTVMFCYNGSQYVVTSLGGGGSAPILPETVTIVLSSTESDNDQNLIGATVTVTNNDTSETILSSSWNGTNIVLPIDAGIYYTVTVSSIQGYPFTPSPRSYSSIAGVSRIITMKYMAEAIDLGLPSGTLWCSHNIGATNIYDRGLYFAWGRTTGYAYGSGHNFNNEVVDTGADLSYSQDAAYMNTNGKYRMPSLDEMKELVDNTDMVRETLGGLSGIKFMKKTDHSIYIFMPGAGWYFNPNYGQDGYLDYLSKTYFGRILWFDNDSLNPQYNNVNGSNGCTVRGVKV